MDAADSRPPCTASTPSSQAQFLTREMRLGLSELEGSTWPRDDAPNRPLRPKLQVNQGARASIRKTVTLSLVS